MANIMNTIIGLLVLPMFLDLPNDSRLIYLNNRYLNSLTGRFISQDKDKQYYSHYNYGNGEVINLSDPTGNMVISLFNMGVHIEDVVLTEEEEAFVTSLLDRESLTPTKGKDLVLKKDANGVIMASSVPGKPGREKITLDDNSGEDLSPYFDYRDGHDAKSSSDSDSPLTKEEETKGAIGGAIVDASKDEDSEEDYILKMNNFVSTMKFVADDSLSERSKIDDIMDKRQVRMEKEKERLMKDRELYFSDDSDLD